jgi:uncharacterized YigZ family protein
MENDIYKTISSPSQGLYKEKGSRFVSFSFPVYEQDEIKKLIETIRKEHHEARHHCYAWMLGVDRSQWRVNDDGEPSGTGGRPILGQINSAGLTNILIVVSRYFGGTLLGVSGLINAYKTSAASAISNAEIVEKTLQSHYEIVFPYLCMNDVMKIIKEENISQSNQNFDTECRITISFRLGATEKVLGRLSRLEGFSARFLYTH